MIKFEQWRDERIERYPDGGEPTKLGYWRWVKRTYDFYMPEYKALRDEQRRRRREDRANPTKGLPDTAAYWHDVKHGGR